MSSIKELPEFASLCSFMQLFGEELNVTLSHKQLATFLEVKDAENVPKLWIDIHRRLLSRIKYNCSIEKWEGTLKKCLINVLGYESDLANLNGTNYFGITADNRAKILNILFDCQFDRNIKFKEKVNLKLISDLRTQPFGSDIHGCVYWLFVDLNIDFIMYKENLEEESFKIVAESLEDLHKLQTELIEIDWENVLLSKLYSEMSPSDEIDNSRNESPSLENLVTVDDKSIIDNTDKLSPLKMEIKEISLNLNEEGLPSIDENDPESNKVPTNFESQENLIKINDVNDEFVEKTDEIGEEVSKEFEETKKTVKNECNDNYETPEKNKKKVVKKANNSSIKLEESDMSVVLRRSERKRKPVNLFSINYIDSCKKIKATSIKTEKEETPKKICKSEKELKDLEEKRKKGRPKKNSSEFSKKKSKEKRKNKKSKGKHKKGRGHKKHKSNHPWENAESSEEHNEVDEEDVYLSDEYESSESITVNEMWDDEPESDFDADKISLSSDEETSKARGRNYFRQKSIKKKKQEIDDKPCQICLKNNIPEMILLCDDCDLGHHAMCLRPSLMIIPEGDWFCPKCQHKKLLVHLSEKINELEKSKIKNNAKVSMQERLNFVNISMTNILSKSREKKAVRKLSRESVNGSETDRNSSSQSLTSSSGSYDSSDNSSESDSKPQGRYKFREGSRKENTKYNFEEIDKIFDDALENDEKYKYMKLEHENREQKSDETQSEESEPEYDYSGIEPRKKSSGKDMANIINEEKPSSRPLLKKKRLKYVSDNDDFEEDTKDVDFTISDQSDSEFDEYEIIEGDVTNCSDDEWLTSRKRSTRKSKRRKSKHHIVQKSSEFSGRPRRSATRNINYRNMLIDEDDDDEEIEEDGELNHRSPDYETSSDEDAKPPPVVSRKKTKNQGRLKKRIISDSEYEEENSKSDSVSDSGSTEKQEIGKRKFKPDLNSDSETETATQSKMTKIDNDDTKSIDNLVMDVPNIAAIDTPPPIFPSLAMLNPMRAKDDEDDDVENEVESETECDLTISLNQESNNQNCLSQL